MYQRSADTAGRSLPTMSSLVRSRKNAIITPTIIPSTRPRITIHIHPRFYLSLDTTAGLTTKLVRQLRGNSQPLRIYTCHVLEAF